MSKLRLAIVIGSIRPNRFGGHAAHWIDELARRRGDFEVELIDLKDYPMPPFAEEASPLYAPSKDEVARRWRRRSANSTPLSSRLPNTIAERPRF
jgi:NAD(P)H-dependent FMN reductase